MSNVAPSSSSAYYRSDNANVYTSNAAFVYSDENTRDVLSLLDPQPGDVILDVGCGTGVLTAKLAAIVADEAACIARKCKPGRVVGIDLSQDMIKMAEGSRDVASGHALEYDLCDAHDLEQWLATRGLMGAFDKVFSNATLHWAKRDPAAVATAMSAALKPDGRLAIEFGGHMNCIGVRSALHAALRRRKVDPIKVDPWYFPTPAQYSEILTKEAGLAVTLAKLVPRPTPLPRSKGLVGWLETFAGPFLNALPQAEQACVLKEVQETLQCDMYDAGEDQWTVMYVRLRIQAHKL